MQTFLIADPARPWCVLFTGTIEQIAEALAAQPTLAPDAVYAHDGVGNARELTARERTRLDRLLELVA
jgi:hypothetical protein